LADAFRRATPTTSTRRCGRSARPPAATPLRGARAARARSGISAAPTRGDEQLPRPSGVGAAQVRGLLDQRGVRSQLRQLASQARQRHRASRVDLPFRLHARRRRHHRGRPAHGRARARGRRRVPPQQHRLGHAQGSSSLHPTHCPVLNYLTSYPQQGKKTHCVLSKTPSLKVGVSSSFVTYLVPANRLRGPSSRRNTRSPRRSAAAGSTRTATWSAVRTPSATLATPTRTATIPGKGVNNGYS